MALAVLGGVQAFTCRKNVYTHMHAHVHVYEESACEENTHRRVGKLWAEVVPNRSCHNYLVPRKHGFKMERCVGYK